MSLKIPVSLLVALPVSATSLTKPDCSSLLTLSLMCSEATKVCHRAENDPGLLAGAARRVLVSRRK